MSEVVNLSKGQRVDLTKNNPSLVELGCGLGWDESKVKGVDFDVDVTVFALDQNNHCFKGGICFFNELSILNGSVVHSADNRNGTGGAGDKETVVIKPKDIPANAQKLIFFVNIWRDPEDPNAPKQSFGQVRNCYIRLYDNITKADLVRYDLTEDYSVFDGVLVAEFYRSGSDWKFGALGNGNNGDINEALKQF